MPEPILFEPEVEQLLREIAADPRSQLLRIPRPAVVRSLQHREREISANATGLTLAERELVRVYRCEAAKLLREACVYRLATHPEGEMWLTPHLSPNRVLTIPDTSGWKLQARVTIIDSQMYRTELGGLEMLEQCVRANELETVTIDQLAAASIRLQPVDQAWIYPAIGRINAHEASIALGLLDNALKSVLSPWHAAFAWTEVGRAHFDLNQPLAAAQSYRVAVELDPHRIAALLGWFASACLASDATQFTAAAERVDSILPLSHIAAGRFATALASTRVCRPAAASKTFARFVARRRDGLGPNTRRIADALV